MEIYPFMIGVSIPCANATNGYVLLVEDFGQRAQFFPYGVLHTVEVHIGAPCAKETMKNVKSKLVYEISIMRDVRNLYQMLRYQLQFPVKTHPKL